MGTLNGKNLVILGASRGIGKRLAIVGHQQGATVLAIARHPEPLAELVNAQPGVQTLALDATQEDAPKRVFDALRPDVLVVCGGATPHMAPVHEQTWEQFSRNWETDVKMSFLFCQAALGAPLAPGTVVILVSSGAGIGGSTISGGYAGAKRTQMFLAEYCSRESARLQSGLRFACVVPTRIMPETELGDAAVEAYTQYLGVSRAEFLQGDILPPDAVVDAILSLAATPDAQQGTVFTVSAKGVDVLS